MTIERLDVSYCEGWDPLTRAATGPLSPGLAAERHQAGEQYAVLLEAGGRPAGVIEVAMGDAYVGARFFDGELAIAGEADCRLLAPGRLFILEQRAGRAEPSPFEPGDKWLRQITATPGGRVEEQSRGGGSLNVSLRQAAGREFWIDAPDFGDWGAFIRSFPLPMEAAGLDVPVSVEIRDVSAADGAGLPAGERPWRAPRGLAADPAYLGWLFTQGTRLSYDGTGWGMSEKENVTVEVLDAGTLVMPSGRVVVMDPSWASGAGPFSVTVPPGSYQVLVSMARFSVDNVRVAAASLVVRDVPVEFWEMALLDGADPRLLPEGGFFGFGVDGGTGCFYDASGDATFGNPEWLAELDMAGGRDYNAPFFTAPVTDPESGANLIAFQSGWGDGSYPVWIGRSADGEVACFVADMQLLSDGATLDAG